MLVWIVLGCLASLRITLPPLVNLRVFKINIFLPPGDLNSVDAALWVAVLLLALAGPWVMEGACRWFCRNLHFSDDTTADFSGRGAQVLGWYVLLMLKRSDWRLSEPWQRHLLGAALFFAGLWASLKIVRWFVAHVELGSGRRFSFTGGFLDLLFWEILLALSAVTIIGWAWALAAIYRWMAENTRAGGQALRFHGRGHQILWRTAAAVLFSLPIVTIPWAWLWYAQWMVKNVTIEGELAEAAA
jgi:uncharacterized membrane protein YjgN (DUF898 family)